MKTIISQIKECIEIGIQKGAQFVIYPYGDIGIQANFILKTAYDLEPAYIIDNKLCRFNHKIKPVEFLDDLNPEQFVLFLTSTNHEIYAELLGEAERRFDKSRILELESMRHCSEKETKMETLQAATPDEPIYTKCGKYSYGPLCNNIMVESVGSFCSFAFGCCAVTNHPINLVSTHPMMYANNVVGWDKDYEEFVDMPWYVPGVKPRGGRHKGKRVIIGNDVWLGHNVLITNGAKIGNGVIAGAGSVITRDVPDYAVVVGAPARIIRYRYSKDEIAALNRISWWDWSDEEIRDRYEDFYLPIEEFIQKYDVAGRK